jgi:hypothetical protein
MDDGVSLTVIKELLIQFHTGSPTIEEPAYIRVNLPYFIKQLQELKKMIGVGMSL